MTQFIRPIIKAVRAPDGQEGAAEFISEQLRSVPALAAFSGQNPAFMPLLAAVCTCPLGTPKEGAVVPSQPDAGVKFSELTAAQGAAIGGCLAPLLASKPAGEAVGEWIGNFPALKRLDKEQASFRLLLKMVGKEVKEIEKNMLKVWFVTVKKSFLSVLDMVTDVLMIVEYLNTPGREGNGHALIGMVALSMLAQLEVVWLQNRKGPRSGLIREVLFVLLALKPGVDAFRVANGEEQTAYAPFDPAMELCESLEF
jgi:hypothetical protein